jgi:tetratricopeptide (TPR) repeat protein
VSATTATRARVSAITLIRCIAVAGMLGAGTAALYMLWGTVPEDRVFPRLRLADGATEPEAWPICTTMSSVAGGADSAELDPDFAAGKRALGAGDWQGAISALKLAALRDPRNADLQNYIGYAYGRLRQLEPAFAHYGLALTLNSRHRAAHEHLGEAYLAMGQLHEAEAHLAALKDVCLIACEEYGDLKRAIAAYNNLAMR